MLPFQSMGEDCLAVLNNDGGGIGHFYSSGKTSAAFFLHIKLIVFGIENKQRFRVLGN
jgi:hypothetical protein